MPMRGRRSGVCAPLGCVPVDMAGRMQGLFNEGAYAMAEKAANLERQGRHVVHLEIGQPDFATPSHVVKAGVDALEAGNTRYTAPSGTAALRSAVAAHVAATRGVTVRPDEVVVGPGAKPGLFFAALALLDKGDEMVYPDPGFPTYRNMALISGARPVPVPLNPEGTSFSMDALRDSISSRTKLVVLNSPSNPTGGVMPQEDVDEVARLAVAHDFWVLSDEIYARLVYGDDGGEERGSCPSILAVPGMRDRVILVDGFSKTYAMTGWRLGWAVMPEALAKKVELLLVHSVGCTASFTQAAALAALQGPQDDAESMRAEFRARRDLVVSGLNAMPGVSCATPRGAFYAFPDISAYGIPSSDLADLLLEKGGVAVLAGTAFGVNGEGHLRLSYVCDRDTLREGLDRIAKVLSTLPLKGAGT